MKIGLIYPNKNNKDKSVHLGLGYIVSYARQIHSDVNFELLDTRVSTSKEKDNFYKTRFDIIGITLSSLTFYEAVDCISAIKKNHPDTKICVGGPYVTMVKEEMLVNPDIDYAVFGEGEKTFAELISFLKGETIISSIKGLIFRDQTIISNEPRENLKDLNTLPIPAYDIFKMDRYPNHRIITSRGCPYECIFCLDSKISNGQWRKRKVDSVIEELLYLFTKFKKKNVVFIDNSFDIEIDRVVELCDKIVAKRIIFLWSANVRGENITSVVAKKLKSAGCYTVSTGIESANNNVLKRIGKQVTIEEMTRGIRHLKENSIEVLGMFMIGNIGDTLGTVKESIAYAKNSELDIVKFYSVIPYKGTPLWHEIHRTGGKVFDKILEFDKIIPPVFFETPEFSYKDRAEAIKLAEEEGFFWYCFESHKNRLIDIGKTITLKMQSILPQSIADSYYLKVKNLYYRFF